MKIFFFILVICVLEINKRCRKRKSLFEIWNLFRDSTIKYDRLVPVNIFLDFISNFLYTYTAKKPP